MARMSTPLVTNRHAHTFVSLPVATGGLPKVSSAYPSISTKRYIQTSPVHMNTLSLRVLTVAGLICITAALFLDYSIWSQLTTFNLTAPLRFTSSALRRTTTEMPSTHKSAKPPSKRKLGNAGWTLIHSIAANYPQKPSANEQYHAKAFLRSIGKLYPCKRCRQHFEKHLAASPPDLSSRDQFMIWACGAHNAVNKRQGKPEFPCTMPQLEKRWGDCGCQLKSGTKK